MSDIRRRRAVWAGLCGIALAAQPAPAGVTLTSRYSEVTATAKAYGIALFGESDGPFDTHSNSTGGFGPFTGQSATAHSASDFSTEADGYAFQNSSFSLAGADLLSASGFAEMTASGLTSGGGQALSSSLDDFNFEFTVAGVPAPYTIKGSLTSNQGGGATLRLFNVTTPTTLIQSFDNDASIDTGGTLAPGQYRFELAGYIDVNTDDSQNLTGGYDVTFALPKPGDANGDGRVNADDFALIDRGYARNLTGWSNGDFNSDGVVNQADYTIIDQAFAQSAPGSPTAPVPEPTATALLALAVLTLKRRRRDAD